MVFDAAEIGTPVRKADLINGGQTFEIKPESCEQILIKDINFGTECTQIITTGREGYTFEIQKETSNGAYMNVNTIISKNLYFTLRCDGDPQTQYPFEFTGIIWK